MHKFILHHTVIPGIEAISIVSDRTFPRHTHDEFGFGYLAYGGQESWSGRGLVEAQAGDVITVNPGELHDGIGRKGEARHWRMLFLTPEAAERCADLSAPRLELHEPVLRDLQNQALVARVIRAATCDSPDRDRIEELLMLAIRSLAGATRLMGRQKQRTRSIAVSRVLDRIEAEAALPLSLSDYAATAEMSRYQILRRFTKEVGATPHAYLTQHRVKQARRKICAGLSLSEAAIACGFSDQSHMTRAFVRQFGITPGRYRVSRPVRACNIVQVTAGDPN